MTFCCCCCCCCCCAAVCSYVHAQHEKNFILIILNICGIPQNNNPPSLELFQIRGNQTSWKMISYLEHCDQNYSFEKDFKALSLVLGLPGGWYTLKHVAWICSVFDDDMHTDGWGPQFHIGLSRIVQDQVDLLNRIRCFLESVWVGLDRVGEWLGAVLGRV